MGTIRFANYAIDELSAFAFWTDACDDLMPVSEACDGVFAGNFLLKDTKTIEGWRATPRPMVTHSYSSRATQTASRVWPLAIQRGWVAARLGCWCQCDYRHAYVKHRDAEAAANGMDREQPDRRGGAC